MAMLTLINRALVTQGPENEGGPPPAALNSFQRVNIALLVLTWVAVLIRLFIRQFMLKGLRYDDLWLFCAQVAMTFFSGSGFEIVATQRQLYMGTTEDLLDRIRVWIIASTIGFAVIMLFVKVSICTTFMRLFWHEHSKVKNYLVYAMLCFSVINAVVFCVLTGVFMIHLDAVASATLSSIYSAVDLTTSTIECVIDVMVIGLACFAIIGTNLRARERVAATILILLGSSGAWISIYRLVILATSSSTITPQEALAAEVHIFQEAGVSILAVSLMAMRPLMSAIFRSVGLGTQVDSVQSANSRIASSAVKGSTRADSDVEMLIRMPSLAVVKETSVMTTVHEA